MVVEVEGADLSFPRIGVEGVTLVVLRECLQGIGKPLFDGFEVSCLCGQAQIICVDETTDCFVFWLVIGVDVEEHRCEHGALGETILLCAPSALLSIHLHKEASV